MSEDRRTVVMQRYLEQETPSLTRTSAGGGTHSTYCAGPLSYTSTVNSWLVTVTESSGRYLSKARLSSIHYLYGFCVDYLK